MSCTRPASQAAATARPCGVAADVRVSWRRRCAPDTQPLRPQRSLICVAAVQQRTAGVLARRGRLRAARHGAKRANPQPALGTRA
jgi:hypothetical protein